MSLDQFLKLDWPAQLFLWFTVTVPDVQAYRDRLRDKDAAPKTFGDHKARSADP